MVIEYVKEGELAIITINRPEVHNALNMLAMKELHTIMLDFRDDPELLVGIITGGGDKVFSAGADVREMLPILRKTRYAKEALPPTLMRGLEIWKPLIAAINGSSLGGGLELALACDLRIASDKASFGLTEVSLGIMPGWGGTQRLTRLIPPAKALELILTGRIIDAEEAHKIGLINKVVPHERLMAVAKEWAQIICRNAPLSIQMAKQAIIKGMDMTLEDGLDLEDSLLSYLLGTEDSIEGVRAFVEKRKPVFKGR